MKFGGQTSKNVHDVRKVCLETTLCVLACFVEFYVFVLNEIPVRGHKIVYKHIQIVNIRENIPKDHPRVLEEGPKLVPKTAKTTEAIDAQWVSRRPIGRVSSFGTYKW